MASPICINLWYSQSNLHKSQKLLQSRPFLIYKQEHMSCPAPKLAERATKQTLTAEKFTAQTSWLISFPAAAF